MQTLFDAAKAVYSGDLDGARAALDDMRRTNYDVFRARVATLVPPPAVLIDPAVQDRLEALMKPVEDEYFRTTTRSYKRSA